MRGPGVCLIFAFCFRGEKGAKGKGLKADGGRYVTNYELRITNDGRRAKGVAKTRGYPNIIEAYLLNF